MILKKRKHRIIAILILFLIPALGLLKRHFFYRHELTTYESAEIRKSFPVVFPIDSPEKALHYGKEKLQVLSKEISGRTPGEEVEWAAYVRLMDAQNRLYDYEQRLLTCKNSEFLSKQHDCDTYVKKNDPGVDYWDVTFQTKHFIPSYVCEATFSKSGVDLSQVLPGGCGYRK